MPRLRSARVIEILSLQMMITHSPRAESRGLFPSQVFQVPHHASTPLGTGDRDTLATDHYHALTPSGVEGPFHKPGFSSPAPCLTSARHGLSRCTRIRSCSCS